MTSSPFITIITPTYNAIQAIEKCIVSVQLQTFLNYEHLIVDGISTDGTIELIKEIQKKTSNIRLITEKDKGVFDAMNKGIQLAQSDWLYFLGADDFLFDNKVLEDSVAYIVKENTQIIYGDVYFENQKKNYDGSFDIEKILKNNICHQSIFYRQSVFKIIGLFNIHYPLVADYAFNLQCWLSGKITHEYFPRTIAYYADGGISSVNQDFNFSKDYPLIITNAILTGNKNKDEKINDLSIAYRKIIQRYSFARFVREVFKKDFFLIRFLSVVWMFLSLPFHAFKVIAKKR